MSDSMANGNAPVYVPEDVGKALEESKAEILGISDFIFAHPELGDEEFESSAFLVRTLQRHGFHVSYPYVGLATAFRAEYDAGPGASIGFLAEYDALPGYGPDKLPGHACGHNWIAATAVGAAIVLSRLSESFSGRIVVFGTHAEETTGRKADMAEAGAFSDMDAVFQMHLNETTNLKARALAMDSAEFAFTGRASHASVHPEDGINALDAVIQTFNGISALRQQLADDVRIHGIITEGGEAANIIPDHCVCQFYVRAARKRAMREVYERVVNCAKGAALMTGAELAVNRIENVYEDLVLNPVLLELTEKNMRRAGFDDLSDAEEIPGSTDVGNVSYRCPTMYGNVGVANGETLVHEEGFLDVANGAEAKDKIMKTVLCFTLTALELYNDADLTRRVREAWESQTK